ncbi:hypothetical protein [Streptomyces rimosus]|uniref:hypothetical protein n=1 Tax=Streptomyces rimosus TaxID=1927 RepID=UPI0004CB2295|nr:hypothetical protein [Streptomyces rimosus]
MFPSTFRYATTHVTSKIAITNSLTVPVTVADIKEYMRGLNVSFAFLHDRMEVRMICGVTSGPALYSYYASDPRKEGNA